MPLVYYRTNGSKKVSVCDTDIKKQPEFPQTVQAVEKPLSLIKNGSQGRSPRQGLGAVAPVKSPFPGERGRGDRDSKLEVCFKNRLFLQAEQPEFPQTVL